MTISFRKRGPGVIELVDDHGPVEDRPGPGFSEVAPLETFEAFYQREFPRMLVLARAVAGTAAAEDLAQDTMLVAYRRWPEIRALKSPGGYVRGICLHKAGSVTRRLIVERQALRRYAARPAARLEPLLPDHEEFWSAVRSLPRRQAQSAALFYALDLSVAEIAITLGCAEGTVKVHLSRARAALGRQLTDPQETS